MILRQNEVIVFQGDSITDGNRGRTEDPNHIMGHGYQFIVGAKLHIDNIDKNIKTYNKGTSGDRVSDLFGRWLEDCLILNPTMISILIGSNDVGANFLFEAGSKPDRFEKIYHMILDEALEYNPNTRFVIMEPFFGEAFKDQNMKEYYAEHIPHLQPVCRKVAEYYGAAFVPLQDMFNEYQKKTSPENIIWDGVHPTIAGHELIAREWFKAVEGMNWQ